MINTELFKNTMEKINNRLQKEKEVLLSNELAVVGVNEEESVDTLLEKSSDTSFKLLVMGRFSSGKSAFVNVLLGEKLLPEKALPTTALITEVYYGEEKKVVMYPKEGRWEGGNEPFEIEPTLEEIGKYSTLNNKAGMNQKEANRIDSVFKKMVIYWPLEMLKDGVSIIDSPGTNDPYSNDYIVESYVPKADAILYCINGTTAYDIHDKATLDNLNSRGFKPIIVTTYFDVVTDGLSDDEKNDFVDGTMDKYLSHTSRDYCHYVNSRLGLKAKEEKSHTALVESGYNELENFLGQYLVEEKGKDKISVVTTAIGMYNNHQIDLINGIISGLDAPIDEFNRQIEEKKQALEQAKLQADLVKREFKVEIKPYKDKIADLLPGLYDSMCNSEILDDFTPDTSFSLWHPKASSQQIAEECSKELEIRNKKVIADWTNTVLIPELTTSFETVASKMQKQFDDFDDDIKRAKVAISSSSVETVSTEDSAASRTAMIAYWLCTGDWITPLFGGIFGAGAFGRALVCQFAAGIVLGIVAMFTPVGLVGFVLAALAGAMGGTLWNAKVASKSIKKKTVNTFLNNLAEEKESILDEAKKQCLEVFDKIEEQLHNALETDIEEAQRNVDKIIAEREENADKIEIRKAQLSDVVEFLKETKAEMEDIKHEFNI